MQNMIKRVAQMKERAAHHHHSTTELVSAKDLYDICVNNDFRCAVYGRTLFYTVEKPNFKPYWSLSLDHIDPLKRCREKPVG